MTARLVIALVLLAKALATDDINEIINVLVDLKDFEDYYDSNSEPATTNIFPILKNMFDIDETRSSTEINIELKNSRSYEEGKYVSQQNVQFEETSRQSENEIPYNKEINKYLQKYRLYGEVNGKLDNAKANTTITTTTQHVNTTESPYDNKKLEDTTVNQKYNDSYKVNEDVFDILDTRTPPKAIVGYTRPFQLNTVRPIDMNSSSIDTEKNQTTLHETVNNSRKNKLNILHINSEYDNSNQVNNDSNTSTFKDIFNTIKSYFIYIHKGILNKIHDFFYKVNETTPVHKRSVDHHLIEDKRKPNNNNVDKTDYFVRHRHISLT